MKVLVTGASGFIGSALVPALKQKGHTVIHLSRGPRGFEDKTLFWDIRQSRLDQSALDAERIDAVIHLAGENIAEGRWTEEKKARLYESRVRGTALLSRALAEMEHPPKVFVSASAIGFYGDRGEEILTEVSPAGKHEFLPNVCRDWENAADPARDRGIRVVHPRIGVVLHPRGGALKAMYWPFQLGLAGNLGIRGQQYMSWITRRDVVCALIFLLEHEISGPVNLVSPNPVRNREFTDAMRKTLIWPIFPMYYWTPPLPASVLRLLKGQMADELLLTSNRVLPVRLEEWGFEFSDPKLRPALRALF